MPNSPNIHAYPLFLFEAFRLAETEPEVRLDCRDHRAAENLRSQMYTLRRLLRQSIDPVHQELYDCVAVKRFYLDGSAVVIAKPHYFSSITNVTISTSTATGA